MPRNTIDLEPVKCERNAKEYVLFVACRVPLLPKSVEVSETGIIGFLIFLAILLQIFIWCFNNFDKHNIYSIIIFISMIGFSMNWLKMDSLRIYAFWLCLAIIFAIDYKKTQNV